jgi:hypothetical protein
MEDPKEEAQNTVNSKFGLKVDYFLDCFGE